ncbi:hypothetical protein ASPWEDRAFT_458664 [Aspergillus wentii DTO 134E9]|uniref:Uncharacterized protein n=1 Tax=Aspergillus wentii DTO 134E9 TaxID=1073089 RepID=A0A1L9RRT4_ASPWE|nr:uncharacterized protein ASPWEDRAFT_458664 [Aspergillus wentii DTO 134E9]OJJ37537.1 hypothetical protein ASPWEDRAFT_458664 [Aspergillus wentii DTO 134E9]
MDSRFNPEPDEVVPVERENHPHLHRHNPHWCSLSPERMSPTQAIFRFNVKPSGRSHPLSLALFSLLLLNPLTPPSALDSTHFPRPNRLSPLTRLLIRFVCLFLFFFLSCFISSPDPHSPVLAGLL